MISDDDDTMAIWSDTFWPDESLFICVFLRDDAHQTRNPDTITSHDYRLHRAIFILIFQTKCIGKSRPKLKNISYLRDDFYITLCVSALCTDESNWINYFFIMCLSTRSTDIYFIFSDIELRLKFV